jgi:cytochrome c biogenesis protein CcdA/glutaredoxin
MNKLLLLYLILLIGITAINADTVTPGDTSNKTCIYFFYGDGCPHCARVEPFIDEMVQKYNLSIYSYEIYNNRSNVLIMHQYYDKYNVSIDQRYIPVIFIGDTYYIGDEPILQNLENKIKTLQQCPLNTTNSTGIIDPNSWSPTENVSFLMLTAAAIADSVNPCTIAVLLLLLTLLTSTGDKKAALKCGIAYILAVFIAYAALGLGIIWILQNITSIIAGIIHIFNPATTNTVENTYLPNLTFWIYKFLGFFAVLVGVLAIRDYILSKRTDSSPGKSVPDVFRSFLRKVMMGMTSPVGAFIAGFVITLFELPCTGGPYSIALGMIAEKATQTQAILMIIYYNLIYILPLVAVLLFVYYGLATVQDTQRWKERNIKRLNLIAGILMIAIGLYMLLR